MPLGSELQVYTIKDHMLLHCLHKLAIHICVLLAWQACTEDKIDGYYLLWVINFRKLN